MLPTNTMLTVAEAAERAGVSISTINRWVRTGHLRAYRQRNKKRGIKINPYDLRAATTYIEITQENS